jgi:hypothetical protein
MMQYSDNFYSCISPALPFCSSCSCSSSLFSFPIFLSFLPSSLLVLAPEIAVGVLQRAAGTHTVSECVCLSVSAKCLLLLLLLLLLLPPLSSPPPFPTLPLLSRPQRAAPSILPSFLSLSLFPFPRSSSAAAAVSLAASLGPAFSIYFLLVLRRRLSHQAAASSRSFSFSPLPVTASIPLPAATRQLSAI